MHGAAALDQLGGRLPEVARRNSRSAGALTRLLTGDPTMWLDTSGQLFVKDRGLTIEAEPVATTRAATTSTSTTSGTTTAAYPLDQTFSLHSLPGSHRTLYLDFDGVDIASGAWVDQGLPTGHYDGWDPMNDGDANIDDRERAAVQEVWARVAEDYAPFDVDVTTEDPGEAALTRSSSTDRDYGTHVVVSDSSVAWQALCNSQCGGVSWVGTFGAVETNSRYQVSWVFSGGTGNLARHVAEAAAHEAGHTFNLTHDGNTTAGYDTGHVPWAPIMGASYYHAVTQWSKGDYAGANNHQDDVALIASKAPLRADEAGDAVASAAAVPTTSAVITSRSDRDVYTLGTCSGAVTVTARPAGTGADLDIVLTLLDGNGNPVATSAPATSETSALVPDPWVAGQYERLPQPVGLDASVSTSLPSASYYAVVDGGGAEAGGAGDPVADYDDYGSLGAYTLTSTGCSTSGVPVPPTTSSPQAPAAITDYAPVVVSYDRSTARGTATVGWQPPASDPDVPVTGYDVSVDGASPVRVTSARYSMTGLALGSTHTVRVAAVNAVGTGPSSSAPDVHVLVPPAPVTQLTASVDGTDPAALSVDAVWTASADNGGEAGSPDYWWRLQPLAGPDTAWQTAVSTSAVASRVAEGQYDLQVLAHNANGESPVTSVPVTVQPVATSPGPVSNLQTSADRLARTVTVTWSAPTGSGSTVQDYLVRLDDGPQTQLPASATSYTFDSVATGDHVVEVVAEAGSASTTTAAVTMLPRIVAPTAPGIERASPGHRGGARTVVFRWSAPGFDGGAPVQGYEVKVLTLRNGHRVGSETQRLGSSARHLQVRLPLRRHVRYAAVVRARNVVGWSAFSARSRAVAPR